MRKARPETPEQRVERMLRKIDSLRVLADKERCPLERGRLRIAIADREAGLAIFRRTMTKAAP